MEKKTILEGYEEVLMPRDVQKILRVSRSTLYKQLAAGTIKSVKVGRSYRIPKQSLADYLYPEED